VRRDRNAATTPYGLVAVTANVGAVGMAGFLLAGGYGPLTTRFGLAVETRWLADLTPDIISPVVTAGAARTSPLSFIALHHFHGVDTRIAPDATAFGMRRKHFMIEICAAWEPSSKAEAAVHRHWMSDLSSVLAPLAPPGGYANLLAPDAHEQIGAAYGNNAPPTRPQGAVRPRQRLFIGNTAAVEN
jgi:hypothetical protein